MSGPTTAKLDLTARITTVACCRRRHWSVDRPPPSIAFSGVTFLNCAAWPSITFGAATSRLTRDGPAKLYCTPLAKYVIATFAAGSTFISVRPSI